MERKKTSVEDALFCMIDIFICILAHILFVGILFGVPIYMEAKRNKRTLLEELMSEE